MALTDNLVSYYKFDESSGNASDSVGSNTATNSNVSYSSAKINNGADFNGSSSVFSITDTAGLKPTGNFSISCWAKFTGTYTNKGQNFFQSLSYNGAKLRGIMVGREYGTGAKVQLTMGDDGVNLGNSKTVLTDGSYNDNAWHHFVFVYDGSNMIIYADGSNVKSIANTYGATYSTNYIRIGTFNTAGSEVDYYSGSLDELSVWSRALSSTEVTSLYNSGNGFQYPFTIAYTLAIDFGQYTYTGVNFLLKAALKMAISTGSYTYTGIDYLFKLGKGMIITTGNYAYTGVDFTLKSARSMAIATGSYVYTGIDFILKKGFGMVISTGSYIYTGFDFILRSSNIWTNQTKNTSTFTNQSKNTSSWSNESKNDSNWTNQNKS